MNEADFATEERIRAKAYQIWLEEGCPNGRDEVHWEMARQLVAIEDVEAAVLTLQERIATLEAELARVRAGG